MATILITGSNQGIGFEFARQYAADGWNVIACCRTPDKADELQALADKNSTIWIEQLDVCDHSAIDALGAKYKNTSLDVLLNNAGIIGPIPIADHIHRQHFGSMDYAVWQQVLETNTFAPIKLAETFVHAIAASEQKKIINISSNVGSISERCLPAIAYGSSKTALNKATTIVAEQLRDRGIIVALFCPGAVKTRMDAWGQAGVGIEDSVSSLRPLIETLTISDSGCFRDYTGRTIAW
ncbi:MAG: SDR family oxidoreductase [Gammaproteobacteria bacterium]|nr:SDR family oxidoreductase [Gammaproteobacteria bacterium]